MKYVKSLFAIAILAFGFSTCGSPADAKDKCRIQKDCSSGFACNLEHSKEGKILEIGICMKINTGGFFLCSRENPCPAGQFCFNGLCAPGCMTDQDCASNQYCDTKADFPNGQLGTHLCVNRVVSSCTSDTTCAENQKCIMGLCSASSVPKQCTPRPDGQDGCDAYSICIDQGEGEQTKYSCVTFPPCPQDGKCPVGTFGSVCNEKDIPEKSRICLTGLCKTVAHCPSNFKCVFPAGSLGMCSNGSLGSVCMTQSDCSSNLRCLTSLPGIPGICMPGQGPENCEAAGGTCIDTMDSCPQGTDLDTTKQCTNVMKLCCR